MCQNDEKQVGGGGHDGAGQQDATYAVPYYEYTTHQRAGDGHEEAEDFGDVGHLGFREAHEIQIEGVRHNPHGDVGDAIHSDHHQDQDGEFLVATEEVQEGPSDGSVEPSDESSQAGVEVGALTRLMLNFVGDVLGGGVVIDPGFPHDEYRHHAYSNKQRHHFVRHLPGPELRKIQGPGPGDQQSQPVAEDIGGRQCRLQPLFRHFDPVGINRHVLGGGRESHQQTAERHHLRCHGGVHVGHEVQARCDARLSQ